MQNVMIFGMTIYDVLFYFVIYAFIGWCIEVSYATLNTGKFVNRGFLNGPICPVYGFGVVVVIVCLTPVKNNLLLLFVCSVILTSLIEYITGFILEKIFHNKWWDYSRFPYNIKGYICLKFSLIWGMACVFVMKIIHPIIENGIRFIPKALGNVILIIIVIGILIDLITTVRVVLKLNIRLAKIEELASKLRQKSDTLGGGISEETLQLEKVYKNLIKQTNMLHKRILNAFPNIKSIKYSEALEALKKNLTRYKNKKSL